MPQTCKNCLGLINSGVCYARQALEIHQVLPYLRIWNHWVRQYLFM